MEAETFLTKYRPRTFAEVLGNSLMISKLEEVVNSNTPPHCYLFTGQPGIGKTTLARIVASVLGATVQEMCAAANSSVDDTRKLVEIAGYKPLDGKPTMVIIDECQNLGGGSAKSKAWQPLLKLTEEPPVWSFFSLCTTDPETVPVAIKSRSTTVKLNPLKPTEIEDLLTLVCEVEGWVVTDSTFQAIVGAAKGQARLALNILQLGHAIADREQLSQIIAEVESEGSPIVELCQCLVSGNRNWKRISMILDKIENEDGLDSQILGYLTNCMTRSEEQQAREVWCLLEAIMQPRQGWSKKAQLAAAVGKICFGNQVF
jgi:DNA polymerase III gamma/tau subunit